MAVHSSVHLYPGATFRLHWEAEYAVLSIASDPTRNEGVDVFLGGCVPGDRTAEATAQLDELASLVGAALAEGYRRLGRTDGPDDPTDEPTDEPETAERDPGPEVDDEGGMSEYRHPADCATPDPWPSEVTSAATARAFIDRLHQAAGPAFPLPTWPPRRAGAHL